MKQFESTTEASTLLHLSSTAFEEAGGIPTMYTCDGDNINPPIQIGKLPAETKTLAIIVDDPDAPGGTFCHWTAWNLPATGLIEENEKRGDHGVNDFGKVGYAGPCPPIVAHRYRFKVYAVDRVLEPGARTGKLQLEKALSGHVLAKGCLTGYYERKTH